jgi:hypothetical protein
MPVLGKRPRERDERAGRPPPRSRLQWTNPRTNTDRASRAFLIRSDRKVRFSTANGTVEWFIVPDEVGIDLYLRRGAFIAYVGAAPKGHQ